MKTGGTVDGVLPVAAVAESLPWRSASSHWYKATGESRAEKHEAKKQRTKGASVKTNAHRKAN